MTPTSTLIIETTRPDHAQVEAMTDVWVEAWTLTMPAIDFGARRAWLVERVSQWPLTLLQYDNARNLLGFALLDPSARILDQIAVSPKLFGSGASRQLLDRAKKACGDTMALDVNTDNKRAIAFYLREGFKQQGAGVNPHSGLATISMRWNVADGVSKTL